MSSFSTLFSEMDHDSISSDGDLPLTLGFSITVLYMTIH